MNKAQAVVLLMTGVAAGVGGDKAISALTSPALAAPMHPYAHAVDLRRRTDDKTIRATVYGSWVKPDGGVGLDLGQAKSCAPTAKTLKILVEGMDALGADCTWEK